MERFFGLATILAVGVAVVLVGPYWIDTAVDSDGPIALEYPATQSTNLGVQRSPRVDALALFGPSKNKGPGVGGDTASDEPDTRQERRANLRLELAATE